MKEDQRLRGKRNKYCPAFLTFFMLMSVFFCFCDKSNKPGAVEGKLQFGIPVELDENFKPIPPKLVDKKENVVQIEIKGEFGGIGLEVAKRGDKLLVVSPLFGSPALNAGIKPKDEILAIDGEATAGESLMECITRMRGIVGTKVILEIQRDGFKESKEFTLTREKIKVKGIRGSEVLDNNIVYLKLGGLNQKTYKDLKEELDTLERKLGGQDSIKGLILDLRYNPGGLLDAAVDVADAFLDSGVIVSIKPNNKIKEQTWKAEPGQLLPRVPLAMIINEDTSQEAEVIAAAIQENGRGVVLGRKSFGNAAAAAIVGYDQTGKPQVAISLYETPGGKTFHESGILPDETMERDTDDFAEPSEDRMVARAVEIISDGKTYSHYLAHKE